MKLKLFIYGDIHALALLVRWKAKGINIGYVMIAIIHN